MAVLTKIEYKKSSAMFPKTGNLVIGTVYDEALRTEQAELRLGTTVIYLTAEQRDQLCYELMELNLNLVSVYQD